MPEIASRPPSSWRRQPLAEDCRAARSSRGARRCLQRLPDFSVATSNCRARPRVFERLAEFPGPPQNPRTAFRVRPCLAENRGGAPKSPTPYRSQDRLSEDPASRRIFERLTEASIAPWDLRASSGILEHAPEDLRGKQNSGTLFRSSKRLSEPSREAP